MQMITSYKLGPQFNNEETSSNFHSKWPFFYSKLTQGFLLHLLYNSY